MLRSMRRASKLSLVLASLLMMAACGPEKRVEWSPDGTAAAVISGGKLFICDAGGNLSSPLMEGVERVAWMPDSRRLAVVLVRETGSWDDLVRTAPVGFDEKKIISAVLTAGEELIGYTGKLDDFKPANSRQLTVPQWTAGILYLRLQGDPRLKEKLGADWTELEKAKVEIRTVRVLPAAPHAAGAGSTLFATLDEIDDLRLAPDGRGLALVSRHGGAWWDEPDDRSLVVVGTASPGTPALVADHVSSHPDWTADGRDLVFARRDPKDSSGLGQIARRAVRNERGEILDEFPESRDLAETVFKDDLKVRCLRDGRVLFAASEVSLPTEIRAEAHPTVLYWIDSSKTPTVSRALPRAAASGVEGRVELFELSPDGTRVAIPASNGRTSVVTLATGEVTEIAGAGHRYELRTVPVWRNADELCLVVPAGAAVGSEKREELVLWSRTRTAVISRTWCDEVISGLK